MGRNFEVKRIGVHMGVLYFVCYIDYGVPEKDKEMFPMLPKGHFTAYINVDKPNVELDDIGETEDGEPYFHIGVPWGINFFSNNGHHGIEGTQYMTLIGWDYGHIGMEDTTEQQVIDDAKNAIADYLKNKNGGFKNGQKI